MAIGEGLLAGCRPVIWPWNGAAEIWGSEYIATDLESACVAIQKHNPGEPLRLPQHLNPETAIASWADQLSKISRL